MFYNTETGKTQTNVCLPGSPRWNWTNEVDVLGIPRTGSLSWFQIPWGHSAQGYHFALSKSQSLDIGPQSRTWSVHDPLYPVPSSSLNSWPSTLPPATLSYLATLAAQVMGKNIPNSGPLFLLPRMFFPQVSMWLTSLSPLSLLKCHTFE